ncbi:MAG: hypothetical protein H6745_19845 [Deltaproteobacteria bacterium]|nr:hypothetical protein [Deltaproteobacteria bacterium]
MSRLNPTPPDQLCDDRGRPYFLWDEDTTLAEFAARLATGSEEERGLDIGKLLRQAKPDDVFRFVSPHEIVSLWPYVVRNLGQARARWETVFGLWEELGLVAPR